MIALIAGGFTDFSGTNSNYINSATQQIDLRGPAPQVCSVRRSNGQWHVTTPFRSFTFRSADEMVSTFNEGYRGDYAAMQTLTPLGNENMFVYSIFIDKKGVVSRQALVTTPTKESFTCDLDPSQSTTPTPTPTPNPNPNPTTGDFVTWDGSQNGVWVKDANNENFAFARESGCLYSQNTKTTYTNFCIVPGSKNRIRFDGQDYYVLNIAAKNGGCVTGIGLSDFRQVDIYTLNGNDQRFQTLTTKWNACSK